MILRRLVAIAIALIAAVAVVAGFLMIGSPEHQRRLAIDAATALDLSAVAAAHRTQPAGSTYAFPTVRVPSGKELPLTSFAYRRLSATTFQLCAVFLEPSNDAYAAYGSLQHGKGRTCYVFAYDSPTKPIATPDATTPKAPVTGPLEMPGSATFGYIERCFASWSIQRPERSVIAARLSGLASQFVSKRPIRLGDAPEPFVAFQPRK